MPDYFVYTEDISQRPTAISANNKDEAAGKFRQRKKVADDVTLIVLLASETEPVEDMLAIAETVHKAGVKVAEYWEYARNHSQGATAARLSAVHKLMNSAYTQLTSRANELDAEERARRKKKKAS